MFSRFPTARLVNFTRFWSYGVCSKLLICEQLSTIMDTPVSAIDNAALSSAKSYMASLARRITQSRSSSTVDEIPATPRERIAQEMKKYEMLMERDAGLASQNPLGFWKVRIVSLIHCSSPFTCLP